MNSSQADWLDREHGRKQQQQHIKGRLCEARLEAVTQGWTGPGRAPDRPAHTHTHHTRIKRSCCTPAHCEGIHFNSTLSVDFCWMWTRTATPL